MCSNVNIIALWTCKLPYISEATLYKTWSGGELRCTRRYTYPFRSDVSTDVHKTTASLFNEEVEGVWSGAAVTQLPVPMTELQFPPGWQKRLCEFVFVSFLPLFLFGVFDSLCGLVAHTMLLFCPQLAWGERTLVRYTSQVRSGHFINS